MSFSERLLAIKAEAMQAAAPMFRHIDEIAEANTLKVLDAMRECQVSEAHFNTTSGYAYDDIGRTKIEELYAKVFGAERALVRTNFVSGTHALATVLLASCGRGISWFPLPMPLMTPCRPLSATPIPARAL